MDPNVGEADHSMKSNTTDVLDSSNDSSGNSILGRRIKLFSDEIEMVLNEAVGQLEERILELDEYFEELNENVSKLETEILRWRVEIEPYKGTRESDFYLNLKPRKYINFLIGSSLPDTTDLHEFYLSMQLVVSRLSKLLFQFEKQCNKIGYESGQIYVCFSDESYARDVKRFALIRKRSPVERSLGISGKFIHISDVIEQNKSKDESSENDSNLNPSKDKQSDTSKQSDTTKGEKDLSKKLVESESEMDHSNTLGSETKKDSTDECSEVDTNLSTSKDEQSDTSKQSDTTKGEKDLSKKLVEEESEMDHSDTLDSETKKDSADKCSEVDTNARSIKDDASEQRRTADESAEVETGENSSEDEVYEVRGTVHEELENVLFTLTNKWQSKLIEIIHRYMDALYNAKQAIFEHFEIEPPFLVDVVEKNLAVLEDNLPVMQAVGEEVKRNFESYKESFKEFHFYIEHAVSYRVP